MTIRSVKSAKERVLLWRVRLNDPTMKTLDLKFGRCMTPKRVKSVAEALRRNTHVRTLDLRWNLIDAGAAVVLSEALRLNGTITCVDMSCNGIGSEGAKAIAGAVLGRNGDAVKTLRLSKNGIGAGGTRAVADALRRSKVALDLLDLSCNHIGEDGGAALAKVLAVRVDSVRSLNLCDCSVGDAGVKALAEALRHNNTVEINFRPLSNIGEEGASALAGALEDNPSRCRAWWSVRNLARAREHIEADGRVPIEWGLLYDVFGISLPSSVADSQCWRFLGAIEKACMLHLIQEFLLIPTGLIPLTIWKVANELGVGGVFDLVRSGRPGVFFNS